MTFPIPISRKWSNVIISGCYNGNNILNWSFGPRLCYTIKMKSVSALQTFLAVLVLGGLFALGAPARAQDLPPTCDAEFHDLMRSRAWMEAQREVEVSETLILKPKSVLAYSCFGDMKNDAKNIKILQERIGDHIDAVFSGISFSCETMDAVSEAMRCTDADKPKIFPSLTALVGGDIRPNCSNYDEPRNTHWTKADDIVSLPSPRPVSKGGPDATLTYLDKMEGTNCGATVKFKTGLQIQSTTQTYDDFVCLAPGCWYDGSTCVAGF